MIKILNKNYSNVITSSIKGLSNPFLKRSIHLLTCLTRPRDHLEPEPFEREWERRVRDEGNNPHFFKGFALMLKVIIDVMMLCGIFFLY